MFFTKQYKNICYTRLLKLGQDKHAKGIRKSFSSILAPSTSMLFCVVLFCQRPKRTNIQYSSQARPLFSPPPPTLTASTMVQTKKVQKNRLVSQMEGCSGKYGYFHMLKRRLPTKSLVESLGLSHKIGLKAIKERACLFSNRVENQAVCEARILT